MKGHVLIPTKLKIPLKQFIPDLFRPGILFVMCITGALAQNKLKMSTVSPVWLLITA